MLLCNGFHVIINKEDNIYHKVEKNVFIFVSLNYKKEIYLFI